MKMADVNKLKWVYEWIDGGMMLDDFHRHEVIDRMSLIQQLFFDYILQHPAIESDNELKKDAEEIFKMLTDFNGNIIDKFKYDCDDEQDSMIALFADAFNRNKKGLRDLINK